MKLPFFLLLCANGMLILNACHHNQSPPLNPNGDSELAILMREMYVEAEQIKNDLKAGNEIKFKLKHEEILTAEATMPEKAGSQEYQSYARIYLDAVNKLKSDPNHPLEAYQNMVASCTSCHQSLCPGPLVRIKKL